MSAPLIECANETMQSRDAKKKMMIEFSTYILCPLLFHEDDETWEAQRPASCPIQSRQPLLYLAHEQAKELQLPKELKSLSMCNTSPMRMGIYIIHLLHV